MKAKTIACYFVTLFVANYVFATPLSTVDQYLADIKPILNNNVKYWPEEQKRVEKNTEGWIFAQKNPEIQKGNSESSSIQKHITKKESDLKKPQAYEEVRGYIDRNKIYRNDAFGFSMNLNQPGFFSEVSNQEGYKYNFAHPTVSADDDVLSVYTADFKYTIRFYQSSAQSHVQQNPQDILSHQLSQFNPSVTIKKLNGKEFAYTQITRENSQVTDYYAMVVNGYYIKWIISYATTDSPAKAKLDTILKSLQFDWISAEK